MVINIKHTIAFLVFTLFIISGCNKASGGKVYTQRSVKELMDSAEQIMNDNPIQALNLLDSIDSSSIHNRSIQARYALLYSETQYKNYVDSMNDSLIMIAVRYYSISNNLVNRFRSYYLLGCIYYDLGLSSNAVVALSEAERLAENIDDYYRLGLLYTKLGVIYYNSFMFTRAVSYFEKSAQLHKQAGKESNSMYALYYIAICKLELEEYDECRSLLELIMNWSKLNSDNNLYYSCIQNMMACSLYDNNIEESNKVFDSFISDYGYPQDNAYLLTLFADFQLLHRNFVKAEDYVQQALRCSPNDNDSANILFTQSRIYKETGKTELALKCYEQSISIQNNNLRPLLQQSLMGTQKDYYHNVAELESIKSHRRAASIIVITLFSLLAITSLVLYHLYNKQKLINKITNSLAIISDLTEKERTNNLKINQLDNELKNLYLTNEYSNKQVEGLKEKIRELFSNQYASVDKLYQDMIRFQDVKNIDRATRFLKNVNAYFNEITSKSNQKKIDKIINETYNNLMVRLSDPCLEISEGDLTMIRLMLIGYSIKTISGLTKDSVYNVYQRRHRLLKKIQGFSEPLATELRKVLRMNDLTNNGGGNF